MSGRASPTADAPPDDAPPDDAPPDDERRLSLRRLARAWPRAIATGWLALVVVLLARVLGDPGVRISGDPDGLLPLEDRAPDDELQTSISRSQPAAEDSAAMNRITRF